MKMNVYSRNDDEMNEDSNNAKISIIIYFKPDVRLSMKVMW
jgi:hypothetical protein